MKAILRSINNFGCKLKQINNLKYNISPKIRSNKFKSISGNGNVTIEDAIKRNLKDYRISGNTYQQQTIGDNIFNVHNGGNISQEVDIIENNCVSVTYDNRSGSTTHYSNLQVYKNEQLQASKNYLMVCEILSVSGTGSLYPYTKDTNSSIDTQHTRYDFSSLSEESKIISAVTTKSNLGRFDLRTLVRFDPGESGSITFRLSLLKDTTVTQDTFSYEPYTGGKPSPSPDYPQEIISCGDRTKNLFDGEYSQGSINSSSGEIYTAYSNTSITNTNLIQVKPNTTYSFSNNEALKIDRIAYFNENKQFISRSDSLNVDTFTTIENCYYIRFNIWEKGILTTDVTNSMINEGSTATSYEPYGYKIPVNVRSDNLATNLEFAWYSSVSQKFTTSYNFKRCTAKIKPNTTYTITKKNASNRFVVITSEVEIAPTVPYKRTVLIEINTNRTRYTFTTQADENYLFFGYYSGTDETEIELAEAEIMIVEGSTAPSKYIPYYNQTTNIYLDEPLRKIGNDADYIDFKNGKVVRKLKENIPVINNITLREDYSNIEYAQISKPQDYSGYDNYGNKPVIFSHAIHYSGPSSWDNINNIGKIFSVPTKAYLWVGFIKGTGLNVIKQKLEGCSIIYPLTTPTEEDIELPNINLIEGKNIITIGTEVYGVFEVEYYSKEIIDISNYKYNLRKVED